MILRYHWSLKKVDVGDAVRKGAEKIIKNSANPKEKRENIRLIRSCAQKMGLHRSANGVWRRIL
jgi:hypothetical protein